MSDKYCPAGKCECDLWDKPHGRCKLHGGTFDIDWEVCPWPSRQVRVEKENDPVAMHEAVIRNESFKHGLAEGIRRCREAVEKLADSHPDINVNAENGWAKLSVIISAIDAVKGAK